MSNSSLATYIWTGSKTNCNPRDHKIDRITIHMMAGNGSLYTCFSWLSRPGNEGSVNYGIDSNGTIGVMIDEKYRAWTSSNRANDMRAVTIEVANDSGAPNWHVSNKAMTSLIALCVDICKRNGIKKLEYTGDKTCKTGNMSLHKWFAATDCPGPYLESKMVYIANEVNKKLGTANTSTPVEKVKDVVNNITSTTVNYLIRVTATDGLNIRKGPGVNYAIVAYSGCKYNGVYTIVAEKKNGSQIWGKLKSGAGWICLSGYTVKVNNTTVTKKSNSEIAKEVVQGKWGSGQDRINRLKAAGYNPTAIQKLVNQLMSK